jgi:hypothetical protein
MKTVFFIIERQKRNIVNISYITHLNVDAISDLNDRAERISISLLCLYTGWRRLTCTGHTYTH